jgi:tetratricopeptide (TPR) repeat protein
VTEDQKQPLSATTFEPATSVPESVAVATKSDQSRLVYIALAVIFALLLFVFFVLPQLVSHGESGPGIPVSSNSEDHAVSASTSQNTGTDAGTGRSPFAEAQESALRRDAQEILQSLLSLQASLAERGAKRWGEPVYGEALGKAASGDTAYRERNFVEATAQYQGALDQLSALESSLPERIESLHGILLTAIEMGDVLGAQARLNEFAEMAPADIRLVALDDRIGALPQVVDALTAATKAEESGDLAAAVNAAANATRADPAHKRAQGRLVDLQSALTRQQFTGAMTGGYTALNAQDFDLAETQFRSAAQLIPGAPEPASALLELDQARTQSTLIRLREQGARAEAEERWTDALTHYEAALEIDALMLFATEGAARAAPRAELDTRLEKLPAERDRLVDARIMGLAQQTLAEAEAIANPGPQLLSQITAARAALDYASTPVIVAITSDSLTDVTLLRVRRLGSLAEETLSLRPGSYTAVGMRNGYRDVRVTFEVRPDQRNTVDVRCVEAI